MKLDLKRIEPKIQFIRDNLALLQQLAQYSEADFLADKRNFYTTVHALQISIEALLDTFSHVVARLHLGAPTNDREILEALLNKSVISPEHFQRYFQMSKFRNKVVHGYIDIDAKKVYAMIQNELGDFQLFFDDLRQIVESEQAKAQKETNRKQINE